MRWSAAKDIGQSMDEFAAKISRKDAVYFWKRYFGDADCIKIVDALIGSLIVVMRESGQLTYFDSESLENWKKIYERSIENSKKLNIAYEAFKARISKLIKKCPGDAMRELRREFKARLIAINGKKRFETLLKDKLSFNILFHKWIFSLCSVVDMQQADDSQSDKGLLDFSLFS
ncbi:MAG: hypothetical protein LBT64_02090 [Puniceicoccales bacterium]|jgi:hypothetical protein|nr:hypothetical protein [Puniceicoccales bacterium]